MQRSPTPNSPIFAWSTSNRERPYGCPDVAEGKGSAMVYSQWAAWWPWPVKGWQGCRGLRRLFEATCWITHLQSHVLPSDQLAPLCQQLLPHPAQRLTHQLWTVSACPLPLEAWPKREGEEGSSHRLTSHSYLPSSDFEFLLSNPHPSLRLQYLLGSWPHIFWTHLGTFNLPLAPSTSLTVAPNFLQTLLPKLWTASSLDP